MTALKSSGAVLRGVRSFSAAMEDGEGPILEFATVVEMQKETCRRNKNRPMFGTRVGDKYEWKTYGEVGQMIDGLRTALAPTVKPGDRVAVISNNRIEWAVGSYAVMSLGAQYVPMYEAQLEKDWRYILGDSGANTLLVSKQSIYDKVAPLVNDKQGGTEQLKRVLCFDAPREHKDSFWGLLDEGMRAPAPVPAVTPHADDVATIIYTSGTTGKPKGVELTHGNISTDILGIKHVMPPNTIHKNLRSMSFLPWAHVFGQTSELHTLVAHGSSLGLVADVTQVMDSFKLLEPTIMFSVPMVFKRIYDGVHAKLKDASPLKQALFARALEVSKQRLKHVYAGTSVPLLLSLQHSLFDKIIFSKVREAMGGKIEIALAGGAATPVEVLEFMERIGIVVMEGYGLTETSPVITVNSLDPKRRRHGTVGVPIGGVTLRVSDPETLAAVADGDEGEVLVSGPNVMKGYRNMPEENAKVFINIDGKRFFRTGDKGKIEDGTFLRLTGRIKEQFKLENGKYVSPVPLEDLIQRSLYVAQAFVGGANKPHTYALVVPDMERLRQWCVKEGVIGATDAVTPEVMRDERVVIFYRAEVEKAFVQMKRFERPARWTLLSEPFSVANQTLTAKLSLRRHNIHAHYASIIAGLEDGTGGYKLSKEAAAARPENDN